MVFIHSFLQAISIATFKSTATQRRSRHRTDTVSEFHAEAPQATASEGLSQGSYVGARAGFEPTTLWKAPNLPMSHHTPWVVMLLLLVYYIYIYIYTVSQKKLCKTVSVRTSSKFLSILIIFG